MAVQTILNKEYLNNLFEYSDGKLFWKNHQYKAYNSKEAGCIASQGYRQVTINKKVYKVHRIIFMMKYGYFPKEIDHIDNNQLNNKIENLREATREINNANRRIAKNNTSSIKNVCKHRNKWIVQVKNTYIGSFDNLKNAELAAFEARNKYYGEYANHG